MKESCPINEGLNNTTERVLTPDKKTRYLLAGNNLRVRASKGTVQVQKPDARALCVVQDAIDKGHATSFGCDCFNCGRHVLVHISEVS